LDTELGRWERVAADATRKARELKRMLGEPK